MMNKSFSQLAIFYYVVANRSFSKAAQYIHCSKAHISKQINELERAVGSPLLHRNTRSLKLTFAGETLFEHARLMVQEFKYAEQSIAGLQNKIQGTLRITAPSAYTDCILAPNLPHFIKEYPELSVELNSTGALLNLVEEQIDVAIRLTHEPPLDRVAKRVGDYRMIISASTDYLGLHKEPKTPEQLLNHPCLIYSTERNSGHWPFVVMQQATTIAVKAKITANNSQALLHAVLNGVGIARLPDYVVQPAVQKEQLKVLLLDYYPAAIPVYAIYAQGRIVPPKIRVFIEFLQNIHQRKLGA